MKYLLLWLALCFTSLGYAQISTAQKIDKSMVVEKVDTDSIVWQDARNEPFDLIGFEWIKQDSVFRRLPLHSKWKVSEAVDQLADQTAGGQLRFQTNSNKLILKVVLLERSAMYHMPATGQSGFDLYVNEDGNQRYVKTSRFPHDTIQYQYEFKIGNAHKMQNFTLNFPLYNGVKSVLVGIEKNTVVKAPELFTRKGKIVIYGTSITQGGCVSRPGMAYSNILSRKLDMEFVNLGFSGSGKGEPELAHLINEINGVRMIVLDYEANANQTIQGNINPFIDILRSKHPKTTILIMSKIRYASSTAGSESYKLLMSNRDFQKNLVTSRKKAGDNNIYFLDGSTVLGDDYAECTVDGSHPSDLGSYRIAAGLLEKIHKIKPKN